MDCYLHLKEIDLEWILTFPAPSTPERLPGLPNALLLAVTYCVWAPPASLPLHSRLSAQPRGYLNAHRPKRLSGGGPIFSSISAHLLRPRSPSMEFACASGRFL